MQEQQISRMAGVAVPLFALRSASDDGAGTIGDLIPFIDWLGRWHQRVVQLLPLNETSPTEASPYNAISAFAFDPTYIATAHVLDIMESDDARQRLASSVVRPPSTAPAPLAPPPSPRNLRPEDAAAGSGICLFRCTVCGHGTTTALRAVL